MSASTTRRSEVVKVSPPGAGGPWQGVDSAVSVACVAPLDLCPGQASPDAEVDLAQAAVMPSLDQDQVALFPVAGRCRSFTGLAFYTFAGTRCLQDTRRAHSLSSSEPSSFLQKIFRTQGALCEILTRREIGRLRGPAVLARLFKFCDGPGHEISMKRELFQKELVERWMLAPNELLLMNKMPERARSIGVRSRTLPNTPQGTVVKVSLPGAGACQNPVYSFIHSVWRRMSGREREAGSLVLTSLAKTEVLP